MEVEIKLKTKLPARIGERDCGEYSATLQYENGKAIVCIHPAKGTAGQWRYRLETLLGLDEYSPTTRTDLLWLDYGQEWFVSNILELLCEIINKEK